MLLMITVASVAFIAGFLSCSLFTISKMSDMTSEGLTKK